MSGGARPISPIGRTRFGGRRAGRSARSGRSRGQAGALVRGRPGILIELPCDMAGIIAGPDRLPDVAPVRSH